MAKPRKGRPQNMAEDIQTSEGEEVVDEETLTNEPAPKETEGEPTQEEVDWKSKFTESQREALRLLDENKALKVEKGQLKGTLSQLEEEQQKYFKALESDNPDAAEVLKLKKSVEMIQKEVKEAREQVGLAEFVRQTKEAEPFREALKKIGRTEPDKSYQDLWETHFRPVYESGLKSAKEKLREEKAKQPETGKGSVSGEPLGEFDAEAINKLPLEKRKAYFKKLGL